MFPMIVRYGLVETYAAKLYARYKEWPRGYTEMLRGRPVPQHVLALASKLERDKFWEEKPIAPPVTTVPPKTTKKGAIGWDKILADAAAIKAARET